jgi:hypothetical protein
MILLNLIIQDIFHWCIVTEPVGASCTVSYTNDITRIWNVTVVLILPIFITFYLLARALRTLQIAEAQQAIMHRNHHRQLIIHSLIFYSLWLSLWLPAMIVNFLGLSDPDEPVGFAVIVASTLETLIDPIIASYLDKRFAQAWKKTGIWIKKKIDTLLNTRVHPIA